VHARYLAHARTFFLSGFVSIENKGAVILIPKLKVASSSLVARSIFPQISNRNVGPLLLDAAENLETSLIPLLSSALPATCRTVGERPERKPTWNTFKQAGIALEDWQQQKPLSSRPVIEVSGVN